jgi:hypothetical protein
LRPKNQDHLNPMLLCQLLKVVLVSSLFLASFFPLQLVGMLKVMLVVIISSLHPTASFFEHIPRVFPLKTMVFEVDFVL